MCFIFSFRCSGITSGTGDLYSDCQAPPGWLWHQHSPVHEIFKSQVFKRPMVDPQSPALTNSFTSSPLNSGSMSPLTRLIFGEHHQVRLCSTPPWVKSRKLTHQHIEAQVPAQPPPVWQGCIPERSSALGVDNIKSMPTTNLSSSPLVSGKPNTKRYTSIFTAGRLSLLQYISNGYSSLEFIKVGIIWFELNLVILVLVHMATTWWQARFHKLGKDKW